jgi:hypothetical protein
MATAVSAPRINDTHSLIAGYLCWIFGFLGMHRFYYGKQITGTIWFFTGGLLLVGWIVDLFLMPRMLAQAERRRHSPVLSGEMDYGHPVAGDGRPVRLGLAVRPVDDE